MINCCSINKCKYPIYEHNFHLSHVRLIFTKTQTFMIPQYFTASSSTMCFVIVLTDI